MTLTYNEGSLCHSNNSYIVLPVLALSPLIWLSSNDRYRFLWTAIRGLVFWIWFIWTLRVLSAPPSPHQALNRKTKTTENYDAERGKWKDFHFHKQKQKFQTLLSSSPLLLHALKSLHTEAKASSFWLCVTWPTPEEQEHLLTGLRRL